MALANQIAAFSFPELRSWKNKCNFSVKSIIYFKWRNCCLEEISWFSRIFDKLKFDSKNIVTGHSQKIIPEILRIFYTSQNVYPRQVSSFKVIYISIIEPKSNSFNVNMFIPHHLSLPLVSDSEFCRVAFFFFSSISLLNSIPLN